MKKPTIQQIGHKIELTLSGVTVSMLATSTVNCGIKYCSGKTKD